MSREITVLLKQVTSDGESSGHRFLAILNNSVKSPLFVFLFGASLATVYPALKSFFTPESELALQKAQEEARADASLIGPFLNNLDSTQRGKFEASRAALRELENTSHSGRNGHTAQYLSQSIRR